MKIPKLLWIFLILITFPIAAADFDKLQPVPANSVLDKSLIQDANYEIKSPVKTDGYSYEFAIGTKFGDFQAQGETLLRIRLQEIAALAKLKEVSGSEAFAKAVGNSAAHTVEATANAVQHPVETVKGIPGGVKRKFENIGRAVKRSTTKSPETQTKKSEENGSNAVVDVSNQVLGVTSAQRQWAKKVGVDPYSRNTVLQQELQRLAKYDAAGKLGTSLAMPGFAPLDATIKVNDLVWANDPEALRKLNEKRLASMGADKKLSDQFLSYKTLTPTDQTYILNSLDALKQTQGRTELIRSALSADSEEDAIFYRDSAAILEKMQAKGVAITRLIPNPKIVVLWSGKRFVAVLPADKLYWTEGFVKALNTFTERHKQDIQSSEAKELWLSGTLTDRAKSELGARGWIIRQDLIQPPAKP